MPLISLPEFPEDQTWNMVYVNRDPSSGEVAMELQQKDFIGITHLWHPVSVDCLELKRIKQFTATTYEATYSGGEPLVTMSSPVVIVKIARFEWELPRVSQETLIYKSLEEKGLAPRFLGRVIGFMLEQLEGREANIKDLSSCQSALQRLHDIGILHGNANRYISIIQDDKAQLIDFEKSQLCHGSTADIQMRWIVYMINWRRTQVAVQGSLGEISLIKIK
ncbi:hypothetical protein N7533_004744 [Penicillium manginii]|jgi:hypothetical protein|uniref:uncharacterized protein n=1 Tax=Penicillium manginii TaxID=203109 RepID=UPI0025492E3A|nr:uncharacterized protein N7533_004744 [Penicillium manginii]KAJ5755201.1 hypothetical protein N7533_004744 [Penicillium manginii]